MRHQICDKSNKEMRNRNKIEQNRQAFGQFGGARGVPCISVRGQFSRHPNRTRFEGFPWRCPKTIVNQEIKVDRVIGNDLFLN